GCEHVPTFPALPPPRRSRAATAHAPRPLLVEPLERRDTPTAPVLTFNAVIVSGRTVLLTGHVTDESPATGKVQFNGVLSAQTTPNSYGDYSVELTAPTLGTISAQATDANLDTSQTLQAPLNDNPPVITRTRPHGPNRALPPAGHVTDENNAGLHVQFGGPVMGVAVTDANGDFSYTTTLWSPGTITAQTADSWGQASNTASVTAAN